MSVRFSVVIPTRERPHTLRACLRTCLAQEFDSFEIVVCDNAGGPATRAVLAEFNSLRLRHVRSERPLAMSDNWELAVSQAQGEFITVLGDDDGLMPYALAECDRLLRHFQADLLHWERILYTWPTFALLEDANYLRLPLLRHAGMLDARALFGPVVRQQEDFGRLPMIYNSVVHRRLLDDLRKKSGRVFRSFYPDVYSGFALGFLVGEFPTVSVPMSIAGLSGHSNGTATLMLQDRGPVAADFNALNSSCEIRHHPLVPNVPLGPVPTLESYLQAKDALAFEEGGIDLSPQSIAHYLLYALPAALPAGVRESLLQRIRDTIAVDDSTRRWFDRLCATVPAVPTPHPVPPRLGFDGEFLHQRVDPAAVPDVAAAVEYCTRLLDYRTGVIEVSFTSPQELNLSARLQRQLDASSARVIALEEKLRQSFVRQAAVRLWRKVRALWS